MQDRSWAGDECRTEAGLGPLSGRHWRQEVLQPLDWSLWYIGRSIHARHSLCLHRAMDPKGQRQSVWVNSRTQIWKESAVFLDTIHSTKFLCVYS